MDRLEDRVLLSFDGFATADVLRDPSTGFAYANVGLPPSSVALGDMDNDGDLDLVVAEASFYSVGIFYNDGTGRFPSRTHLATRVQFVNPYPHGVEVADLNGDKLSDILALDRAFLEVFLRNGNSSFAGRVDYLGGSHVDSITIGDLGGDGFPEAVISSDPGGGSPQVQILKNNGTGVFKDSAGQNAVCQVINITSRGPAMAIGDIDGNQKADLVLVQESSDSKVYVYKGIGNCAVDANPTFITGVGQGPSDLKLVDLNHDQKSDLIVTNKASDTISVGFGNGSGGFSFAPEIAVGDRPKAIAVADVDRDGNLDIVTANEGPDGATSPTGDSITLLLGRGDGTFAVTSPAGTYSAGNAGDPFFGKKIEPSDVALGDLDGNGCMDAVVGHGNFQTGSDNVTILPARGACPLQPPPLQVTRTDDVDDGACTDSDCSLREAINAANARPGDDTISFRSDVRGIIKLTAALPSLSSNISINGPGANLLTVRRDTSSNYRIFSVPSGANVTISGLTIEHGYVLGYGGGVFNSGTLTLSQVVLKDNTALLGGGISNAGNLTMSRSTILGNTAVGSGGGMLNSGTATIDTCTISGNSISGNSTGPSGGGVRNSGTLDIHNCTIVQNQAIRGTGGGLSSSGTTTVANTILAGNTAAAGEPDCSGTLTSSDYNLIQDPSGCSFLRVPENTIVDTDPKLGPLQDNGGSTFTHALLSGSPAIDAGSCGGVATDQRGTTRPVDLPPANANDGCDIGSFEFERTLSIAIDDVTVTEGNSGTATATFTVSLSVPSSQVVSVIYVTLDGSATAPADYTSIVHACCSLTWVRRARQFPSRSTGIRSMRTPKRSHSSFSAPPMPASTTAKAPAESSTTTRPESWSTKRAARRTFRKAASPMLSPSS